MIAPRSQASQASPAQALDDLLSNRGLPYPEAVKPTIRSHLSSLLQEFPDLHVKIEVFPQGDKRAPCLLLQVGGTIPISFLQVIYNIPVVIRLSTDYPFRAPLVFVTPSPFMIIKTAHPLVDHSGFVSCPPLSSWVSPPSNLADLVRGLCTAFGHDPPLYSVMHPRTAHDVKLPISTPLPASSLFSASTPPLSVPASCTSVSLLGPGTSTKPHPLYGSGGQISMAPLTMPSVSTSTSLLGPGVLSPHFPSHAHARDLLMASLSQPQLPVVAPSSHNRSLYAYSPSVSIAGASTASMPERYTAPVLSSQQHAPAYRAEVSVAHSSSAPLTSSLTSTSTSLLGPGKVLPTSYGAGRHAVVPYQAELSKCPTLFTQGNSSPAYDVGMAAGHHPSLSLSTELTSAPTTTASLLGPGKVVQLHSAHGARDTSLAYLPAPAMSGSWIGQGSLGQWRLPNTYANGGRWNSALTLDARASTALLPTLSTSASLLGDGSISQGHCPHDRVGISTVRSPQPSAMAPSSSSLLVPGTLLQQHINLNYGYGTGESLHTSSNHVHNTGANAPTGLSIKSSNPMALIPMQQDSEPSSTSSQQPAQQVQFSNPIFGPTYSPPDKRQSMINALVDRMQCDIDKIRKAKEMDMLDFMDTESMLKQRQGSCERSIQGLQQQKENLEGQLQRLLINSDVLETWLVANDKSDVNIEVDEIFEPCNGLSNQLLECAALDLAIEDALYCLERAAQDGQLTVDAYLRHVRTLSREQFFHRAMAVKIRATQGQ